MRKVILTLLLGTAFAQYPSAMRQTNAQLTTIALPPVPFSGLVGAGTSAVIQPYGTTLIRCTDVNTDPTNTKTHSSEVTDTGGDFVYSWNSDQTMLRVVRMANGNTDVLSFNGQGCILVNTPPIPAGAQWSLNNPNVDYYEATQTKINKRDFSTTPPTVSTLFDFENCELFNGIGTVTYNTQIVSNDDNVFYAAFGTNGEGQDTAQYVAGYRVDTHVCVLYNTVTGMIQQAGGIPDVITIGQVAPFYPFTIHSMYLALGGQLQVGIGSTCTGCPAAHGPFIWYPATTHLDIIPQPGGGHNTSGYLNFINITSAPKTAERLFTNLGTVKYISSNTNTHFPTPFDIHMAWQNDNLTDTNPICASQMSLNLPQPITITSPLENEIWCIDPVSVGTFLRLTPSFSSGNPQNFRTEQAIMANGTKGYIAFTSDMEGTLGSTDGVTPTCTLGTNCRSDVFIVVPH